MAYWQGRFSQTHFETSSFLVAVLLVISCILHAADSLEKLYDPVLKDFPVSVIQRHISLSRHHPVCVLFRKQGYGSKLESDFHSLWRNNTVSNFSSWEIGSFVFKPNKNGTLDQKRPDNLPTLRCYLGQTNYYEYDRKPQLKYLKNWIDGLVKKHTEQLQDATPTLVDEAVSEYRVVIVAFPDTYRHLEIEEMVFQACEKTPKCKAFIVHAHSLEASELKAKFEVYEIPAVVIIHNSGQVNSSYRVRRFIRYHITKTNLDVYLKAREIPVRHLDLNSFEKEVLTVQEKPFLVGFYASWARFVDSYLSMFKRSYKEFTELDAELDFGLVDLSEDDNKRIVRKWLHAPYAIKVPFTILFHRDGLDRIIQTPLADRRPTPFSVYNLMKDSDKPMVDNTGLFIIYEPWGSLDTHQISSVNEGPYGRMCSTWSHNQTDNNPQLYWKKWKISKKKTKKSKNRKWHQQFSTENLERHLEKINGIPVISSQSWSEMIEKSHAPSHPFYGGKQWAGEITKVAMVVFIIADCRSCNSSMAIFKEIQQSVKFIEGGSLYIINCTDDKELCLHHKISGYPTITAFRGLGWLGTNQCVSRESQTKYKNYIRLDYHGVIQMKPVMDWFVTASGRAVENRMLKWPDSVEIMKTDVTVTGVLMPKMSRFLPIPPNRNKNYYYSYQCFRLACERLYGKAKCFGVYSKDIPQKEFIDEDIDVIVSKVILERKDGVAAVIMQLGKALKSTLSDDTDPLLHKFHRPHRYDLKENQKCEDNHAACTDVITSFTVDHSRLPVSAITSTAFHTSDSEQLDENMPVLIALIHPDNITEDSDFLKILTTVSYDMYNDLMVTTLNVEEYASWAGQFIPVNYRKKMMQDDWDPDHLFTYPRLCFIQKQNHRKAAFYPPIHQKRDYKSQFTEAKIVEFAKKFVKHPTRYLVQTEHF